MPFPGNLPDPGIKFASLRSPALAGGFFTTSAIWNVIKSRKLGAITGGGGCKEGSEARFF